MKFSKYILVALLISFVSTVNAQKSKEERKAKKELVKQKKAALKEKKAEMKEKKKELKEKISYIHDFIFLYLLKRQFLFASSMTVFFKLKEHNKL